MAVTLSAGKKKKMVICSYPCKIRPIAFLHRMNTRLSHGYSMLGVAAKKRNFFTLTIFVVTLEWGGCKYERFYQ